jgi:hypothetical protein
MMKKQKEQNKKPLTQSGGVEWNRNSDLTEESLDDVLESGGEPSCEEFLICGQCPKSRYLSKDCPFNIIDKGYELCDIQKEP